MKVIKLLSATRSFLSISSAKEVDDDTLLADLVEEVTENKTYPGDVGTSPKVGGGEVA